MCRVYCLYQANQHILRKIGKMTMTTLNILSRDIYEIEL